MEFNGLTIWRGYLPLLTILLFMMLVEQLRRLLEPFINKKELPLPDMIKKLVEASNLDNLFTLRNVCIFLGLSLPGFSELRRFFT